MSDSVSSAAKPIWPSREPTTAEPSAVGIDQAEPLLVVLDERGHVQQMNRACEQATGWRLDDLRDQPIWAALFDPASAAEVREGLAHPAGSPQRERLAEWIRRDGARLIVSWSMVPLPEPSTGRVLVALDVSALRAADLALRENDAALRTLAQTTTAAIFIHRDARVFYVNPAAEALTGYTRAELLAIDFWSIVHPAMREVARAQHAVRVSGGAVPVRNEVKIVTKSGEERWVEFTAAVIQQRGSMAVVGTAFDVSERHRAQAAQRDRERRFRALIEHSSDVVSVIGIDARLIYVGPSVSRILGHAPHDLEGRSILDLIHADDRAVMRRGMRDAMARPGEPITVQYRLQHADGSWRWMEGVGTNLLHEPMVGGIIANVRDVTPRRRAEDLLRESERRFALAVDGAKDGIWDWNVQSDEFYMSPRMREILEFQGAETPRVAHVFGQRVHPDDLAEISERWQRHMHGDGPHYEVEYRLRAADGTYRWVLARGATVRDSAGAPQRMVGSLTDITARKRAQEEARQRQAELAHVLRVSVMGEMATGLAHELNQPLAAIVNYARGCARRLADTNTAPDILNVLERIAVEALRAGDVVRGLKRVVRKEPPRDTRIDLNEVARDAVDLVRSEAAEREIGLRMVLQPDLPRVQADRIQIEQVMLNLLRNAVEAISRQSGVVCLRTGLCGEDALVAISDTGDGIAPDQLESVFTPFFTTKANGLGMGLSISRTIIEAHRGRLWAEVNPGEGTTFSFSLPLDGAVTSRDKTAGS